jgi:undecaprenyl-phosphate galactose phosphotransferase
MMGVEAQVLFTEEILMLHMRNNLSMRRNKIYKRIFDLVCTIGGGLMILPIIAVVALLVAIDNKGNVIFAHRRIGKDGKEFPCYKFQSMVPNAQEILQDYLAKNSEARKEWEESFKLTNDPRVTKLGGFLRKTSLDELPQLWNVIKGDMSLVGPRPIVKKEIERYGEYFREYAMVLPGITGMWQASGRSDTTYEERVEMDTWYVRNWSVWLDIMYLAKTFTAVIFGKGAY